MGVDVLTIILVVFSVISVMTGFYILNRKDLEIGALIGAYPLAWGVIVGFFAILLFILQHVSFVIG